jgi:predicted Zn-ribbon and HTH transcriptional regulator
MARPPRCPKCSGNMDESFVLDRTHGANLQSFWVEGPATKRFLGGVQLKDRERIPVTTFRCSKCGYLESFAPLP